MAGGNVLYFFTQRNNNKNNNNKIIFAKQVLVIYCVSNVYLFIYVQE